MTETDIAEVTRPSAFTAQAERVFPTLTPAQIARIAARGRVRPTRRGEVLFEAGAAVVPFFVVTAGEIEIVRRPGEVRTHDHSIKSRMLYH